MTARARIKHRSTKQSARKPNDSPSWVVRGLPAMGVLSLAFGAGMLFGANDAPSKDDSTLAKSSNHILDEMEQRAHEYDAIQRKVALTFHRALTETRVPIVVDSSVARPSKREPPPVAATEIPTTAASNTVPLDIQKPKAMVEPRALETEVAGREPEEERGETEPKRETASSKERIRLAFAKIDEDDSERSARYLIQLGSWPTEAAARAFVAKAEGARIAAKMERARLASGDEVFRVVTAAYPHRDAAVDAERKVRSALGVNGLIRVAQ